MSQIKSLLSNYFGILRSSIFRPLKTGAIVPSSIHMADGLLAGLDLNSANLVIEVGVGMGAITRRILEKMPDPSKYIGIELDPVFVRAMRKRYPMARFEQDSAENILKYAQGEGKVDIVVGTLPWTLIPPDDLDLILGKISQSLKPGGCLTTLVYVHGQALPTYRIFREKLRKHFSSIQKTKIIWNNVPPASVHRIFTASPSCGRK